MLFKNIQPRINQISNKSFRVQLLLLIVFAVIVRVIYWIIAPEAKAGDSHAYLFLAQNIIDGNFSDVLAAPFHLTYAFLLIPGLVFPSGLSWYIPLLHIVLSSISVVFLFLISMEITTDERVHRITAILGVFYPYLLHWMKYILTEVAFVSILLAFIFLSIKVLKGCGKKIGILWGLCAVILLVTRPVSILILIVVGVATLFSGLRRKFPENWRLLSNAILFIGILMSILLLSITAINQRVLSLHAVTESLWLSTRVVSGTFDEYKKAELPPETFGMSALELREYKKDISIDFIRTQPLKYLLMAIQRFFNYFYPWIYPQWSFKHRIFDAVLSLGLTITTIASLYAPAKRNLILLLVSCVLALGVTTAFSQIDTDGRYRLPAEVLIIPASSVGIVYLAGGQKKEFE